MTPIKSFTDLLPEITSAGVRKMFAWGSLAFGLFSLYMLARGLVTRTVVIFMEFWDTPVLPYSYDRDTDPISYWWGIFEWIFICVCMFTMSAKSFGIF